MHISRSALAAFAVAASFASVASADVILGNYPQTNDTGTTADTDNLRRKALSFAMPAGVGYNISSITLRLGNYITPGDIAVLEIRDHTGSTTAPGLSVIGAFTAPASAAATIDNFIFTPIGTVTLNPSTSYWIYVYGANANTSFDWRGSSPSVTPTGIATYGGQSLFTVNGGTSWTTSVTINTFQIDGTVVPAPATAALLLAGLATVRRRRR
jgi:hypothetical protein